MSHLDCWIGYCSFFLKRLLMGSFNVCQVNLKCLGLGEFMEFEPEFRHRRLPIREKNAETNIPFRERTHIPPGLQELGVTDMATKQNKKDNRLSDKEAMHLAETTDVSPQQAKDLIEKHGKAKAEKEAKNFKAEG
jgi:hypothetical protein